MIREAIANETEFGIVLAKEEGIVNAGCTVKVESVLHRYPDGRMDVLTMGQRRFEIHRLNEEKDYLQAEVSYFDDEDKDETTPTDLRDQAVIHYHALNELSVARSHSEPDFRDPQLSFQIAQAVPDLDFLHALLRHRSEVARLKELNHYLSGYLPRQKSIERMRELAPKNGFGHKPAGL
jgi:ATP-dependent Lon protease